MLSLVNRRRSFPCERLPQRRQCLLVWCSGWRVRKLAGARYRRRQTFGANVQLMNEMTDETNVEVQWEERKTFLYSGRLHWNRWSQTAVVKHL